MRTFVGVTDNDWFSFLKSRPGIDEVNFWQPGGNRQFRVLSPGEPFLFKLHSPLNFIVGGGFFTHSTLLPCSLAWEAFGEKNGAVTFEEMRRRIERYRRIRAMPSEDYAVGCIVLSDPFFFDREAWIPVPDDWRSSIVQGRTYDCGTPSGKALWEAVTLRLRSRTVVPETTGVAEVPGPIYGESVAIRPRLHQGAFRVLVTDVYERRCAVTRERSLPVLEAAHIRPVSKEGMHSIGNGLLLRSDIHRLFDRGYVTVTPDHRFLVSRKLKEDYDNGRVYYDFNNREVWIPESRNHQPDRQLLEWHADSIFLR